MPYPSNTTPRKLWYPLNRVAALSAICEGEGNTSLFSWPTTDNDEKVVITLELSLNEYVALATCIDVGSDIAYNQDALKIWWIWIRANTMAFCDNVNSCITSNPSTQTAITTILNNNGTVNPNSIDGNTTTYADRIPDGSTQTLSEPPPSCDKDALWAGIREMVDRLDQNGRDVLEDLSVINDKVQQIGEIIDLVPILGDIIKDISDLFTEQIPDLLDAYNAASSPTFLDNVACDIFEMVCTECRYPTFDEMFQYLVDYSYFSIPNIQSLTYVGLWDLVKEVTGLTPEALWYSINVWQCFTIMIDATFNQSYGAKTFAIWCTFGEDNPNDNWTILCDGCEDTWCYEFSVDNGLLENWTPLNTGTGDRAVWHPGEGWGRNSGSLDNWIHIWTLFGVTANIDHISIYTNTAPTYREYAYEYDDLGNTIGSTGFVSPGHTVQTWDGLGWSAGGMRCADDWNGSAPATARLYKVIISGSGSNPFGSDNCA